MKLEVGVWKWRDTDNKAWIEYDSNNSLLLEDRYVLVRESLLSLLDKEDPSTSTSTSSSTSLSSFISSELKVLKIQALVTLPSSPYRVDVFQMFQENLKTGFKRTVRRFPPPLPSISRRNTSSPSIINPSSLAYVFFSPSFSSSTRLEFLTKAVDGLELAPGERILFLFPPSYYSSVISSVILAHRKSEDYLSSVIYKNKAKDPEDYEDQQGAYSMVFAHPTTPVIKRGPGRGKVMKSALAGRKATEGTGTEGRGAEEREGSRREKGEGEQSVEEVKKEKQEGETDTQSSWLVWEDEYSVKKFAEPRSREDPEIENLHDWESYVGILRANRIQVLSSGNPDHECAILNFHSLSVRFQQTERTTSVIEETWSPGLKFRPWEEESTDMPLFRCTSRHLSHEVIEKEGVYPAAVCIGPLGYYHRKMPGAPSSSSSPSSSGAVFLPSTRLEEYWVGEEKFFRLRIKLPEGKIFHFLEVACGDTFIDPGKPIGEQKNKDGHYGTLGWARLWAKISSSSSSSSRYFMENENVPPFGVLFGGPREAEAERIKAGDELLIESRRFPTWIMGYRAHLSD